MDIGKRILEYRVEHGISQKEFARRARLSEQTVNSVENGLQHPTALTVGKIEKVIEEG